MLLTSERSKSRIYFHACGPVLLVIKIKCKLRINKTYGMGHRPNDEQPSSVPITTSIYIDNRVGTCG